MKQKKKDWKIIAFSLEKEVAHRIKELAEYEGMSKSEWIEYIIQNWQREINPEKKLEWLMTEREKQIKKINKIEKEIKKVSKQIRIVNELRKKRVEKKKQAIEVIQRKILDGDIEEVNRIAKVWQRITGISAIELITEAMEKIQRSGI